MIKDQNSYPRETYLWYLRGAIPRVLLECSPVLTEGRHATPLVTREFTTIATNFGERFLPYSLPGSFIMTPLALLFQPPCQHGTEHSININTVATVISTC